VVLVVGESRSLMVVMVGVVVCSSGMAVLAVPVLIVRRMR
jgi:hypothetical protein